jgi:hypothetical protein
MPRIEFVERRWPDGTVTFTAVPVTLMQRLTRAVRRIWASLMGRRR